MPQTAENTRSSDDLDSGRACPPGPQVKSVLRFLGSRFGDYDGLGIAGAVLGCVRGICWRTPGLLFNSEGSHFMRP